MPLQILSFILYIPCGLKLSGEACYEHQLPHNVLQLFGTSAAHTFKSSATVVEPAIERLDQNEDDPLFL